MVTPLPPCQTSPSPARAPRCSRDHSGSGAEATATAPTRRNAATAAAASSACRESRPVRLDGTARDRMGTEGGDTTQRPGMMPRVAATMALSCGTNGTPHPMLAKVGSAWYGVGTHCTAPRWALEWKGREQCICPLERPPSCSDPAPRCRGHQPCPGHSKAAAAPVGMPQGPGLSPKLRVLSPAVQQALRGKQPR